MRTALAEFHMSVSRISAQQPIFNLSSVSAEIERTSAEIERTSAEIERTFLGREIHLFFQVGESCAQTPLSTSEVMNDIDSHGKGVMDFQRGSARLFSLSQT